MPGGDILNNNFQGLRYVIASAFSVRMLERKSYKLYFIPIGNIEWYTYLVRSAYNNDPESVLSVVGHEDTARLFTEIFKVPILSSRIDYVVRPGDLLIVGIPSGGRLPEGKVLTRDELMKTGFEWWGVKCPLTDNG